MLAIYTEQQNRWTDPGNKSLTDVREIGNKAAQFDFSEYIIRIFFTVCHQLAADEQLLPGRTIRSSKAGGTDRPSQ